MWSPLIEDDNQPPRPRHVWIDVILVALALGSVFVCAFLAAAAPR
ncbi:MAG TPA: hypothetical protein VF400_01680 [Anaeromyxobacteraceae bacterium]